MLNSINANRIKNEQYINEHIDKNVIDIYPTQLIFCFLHLEQATNCSRQTFFSGPTSDSIKKDIKNLTDDSIKYLAHKLPDENSIEIYNWVNKKNKRQLYFLQNTIPLIVKENNPLKFKDIKNISLYRFDGIDEFTNLRIQLDLNFPLQYTKQILSIAHQGWIATKNDDLKIEKWFNRSKKDIKSKLKSTWKYFKNKKEFNENNVEPKDTEDVLIYFDMFCRTKKSKEIALEEIQEIFYAANRAKKREGNQTQEKQYKQLTGYVPDVIREILNAMAAENEMYQGELVMQWAITELNNPKYAKILERFKYRLSEIEDCNLPRHTKSMNYQPQESWIQKIMNNPISSQPELREKIFGNENEKPALYRPDTKKIEANKNIPTSPSPAPGDQEELTPKEATHNQNATANRKDSQARAKEFINKVFEETFKNNERET
ncbi:hypothetical protein [Vogesella indigofera]|uniref:hypothetical protein n=1 Tax=Vogesella indigofera TaxID=45465 RepID=UPI00234F5766|nr:hypothetical protein [Vogesella indigofera]MDC7698341.1 hypothetical protein [Vogesella indigofera]